MLTFYAGLIQKSSNTRLCLIQMFLLLSEPAHVREGCRGSSL